MRADLIEYIFTSTAWGEEAYAAVMEARALRAAEGAWGYRMLDATVSPVLWASNAFGPHFVVEDIAGHRSKPNVQAHARWEENVIALSRPNMSPTIHCIHCC